MKLFFKIVGCGFVLIVVMVFIGVSGDNQGYHEVDEVCRGSTCTQMITEDTLRGKRTCMVSTDKLLGTQNVNCIMH